MSEVAVSGAGNTGGAPAPVSQPQGEGLGSSKTSNNSGGTAKGSPSTDQKVAAKTQGQGSSEGGLEGHEVTKVTAPSGEEKFAIKVDGKEMVLSREEAIKYAQMGAGAQKRFQEANNIAQKANSILARLKDKNQVRQVLIEQGLDPDQLAEETFVEKIRRELMTPEQKAQMERDMELNKYREAEQKRQEAENKAILEREVQAHRDEYDQQISKVLTNSDLPRTPETVQLMAKAMLTAMENGFKTVTPADVVDYVRERLIEQTKIFFDPKDVEKSMKYIPKEYLDAVRKYELQKLQNPEAQRAFARQPNQQSQKPVSKGAKKLTKDEFKALIEKRVSE